MSPYYLQTPENQSQLVYTAGVSIKLEHQIFTLPCNVEDAQNITMWKPRKSIFLSVLVIPEGYKHAVKPSRGLTTAVSNSSLLFSTQIL